MAEWKKVILSGSAAQLSSLTLTTPLADDFGGTGLNSYSQGDILYYDGSALAPLNIGSNGEVLKSNGTIPVWGTDASGTVTSVNVAAGVTAGTMQSRELSSGVFTIEISSSAPDLNSGNFLATGTQISGWASSNFNNNAGTITRVSGSGTVNGLTLSGDFTSGTANVQLGGTLSDITNANFSSGADEITVGTNAVALGGTLSNLTGLSSIDVQNSDTTVFANTGNTTLTIAASTSTVKIPGNLIVEGTSSFTDAETLNISDKVIVLSSGSTSANAGGFIVMQDNAAQTGQAFGYDNTKKSGTGTYQGRWGFHNDQADATTLTIEEFVPTVQVDSSAPSNPPQFGGESGQGNIAIDTSGDMYIYI